MTDFFSRLLLTSYLSIRTGGVKPQRLLFDCGLALNITGKTKSLSQLLIPFASPIRIDIYVALPSGTTYMHVHICTYIILVNMCNNNWENESTHSKHKKPPTRTNQ